MQIPLHVIDRVEVDYPGDCLTHTKTVVFNSWVESGLSMGHKVNYIKNAFNEGGRPAVFGRIVRDFQDLVKLAKQHYSSKGTEIPLVVSKGLTPPVFTNETSHSYEYLHKGLISKRQFTLIHILSEFIKIEDQYIVLCDVLGQQYLESYHRCQVPDISWMHEAEVTLTLFLSDVEYVEKANIGGIHDAFNMCELEPHCNEALVASGFNIPELGDSLPLLQGQASENPAKGTPPPSTPQEEGKSGFIASKYKLW